MTINKLYKEYIDTGNEKLLHKIAKKYVGFIVSRSRISDDLFCSHDLALSYAYEGLAEALTRYDDTKNCSFNTFLHYRMMLKTIYSRQFLEHSISSVNFSRYTPDEDYYDTDDLLSENYFRMDYSLEAKNYEENMYHDFINGEITIDNLQYWAEDYLNKEETEYIKEYLKQNNTTTSKKSKKFAAILEDLKAQIEKY